ncbi:MAG: hypothetical protein LUD50_07840, partial [Clostridia bacterium]|nr:hypothetical protein [Clostridia bacterium]
MDTDIRYINGLPDAPFKKKTNETPDYKDDDILLVSSLEFKTDPLPVKVPRNVFFFCHGGNVTIETPEGHYRLGAGDTFICPTGTAVKVCNY